jgi:hypothetical protein
VTVVDWPVVHSWSVGDPDFVGAVTILDEEGAQLATVEWPAADGSGGRPVPEQARVASVTRTTQGLPRQSHG